MGKRQWSSKTFAKEWRKFWLSHNFLSMPFLVMVAAKSAFAAFATASVMRLATDQHKRALAQETHFTFSQGILSFLFPK